MIAGHRTLLLTKSVCVCVCAWHVCVFVLIIALEGDGVDKT